MDPLQIAALAAAGGPLLAEASKNADEALRAAAEAAKRQAERVKELTDRYGRYADTVQKAAQRNRSLSESLKDGTFARHASDLAKINREYASLHQRANLTELIVQHGQFGAVARTNATQLALIGRTAGFAVGGVLALGTGLARAGLAGTVEGYRLEYAWMRLSRQVAAVAVPAVNLLSKYVGRAADWFSKLNGEQQDTILKVGLVTAGVLTLGGALRTLVTVGGAAVAVLRTVGMVSSITAASTAVAGSALAAAPVAAAGLATTAGAVATGTAGAAGTAGTAGAAGGAAAAARGSRLGMLGRAAGRLALPVAFGAAIYDAIEGGNYGDYRRRGHGQFASGLGAFAGNGGVNFLFRQLSPRFRELQDQGFSDRATAAASRETTTPHRDVSVNQASLLEAGQSHFNIQESLLKVMAAREEDAKELQREKERELELLKKTNDAREKELQSRQAGTSQTVGAVVDRAANDPFFGPAGEGAVAFYRWLRNH